MVMPCVHGDPAQEGDFVSCSACSVAAESPRTGRFNAGCFDCECRHLAHSPAARDAVIGHPQALKAALLKLFPEKDKYLAARVAVHGWIKRLL